MTFRYPYPAICLVLLLVLVLPVHATLAVRTLPFDMKSYVLERGGVKATQSDEDGYSLLVSTKHGQRRLVARAISEANGLLRRRN